MIIPLLFEPFCNSSQDQLRFVCAIWHDCIFGGNSRPQEKNWTKFNTKGRGGGGGGGLWNMVQPLTILYNILDKKGTPFVYLLLTNDTLYLFYLFIYFATQNVQRKKEKIKIHYRTKLARKPLIIETTELIT